MAITLHPYHPEQHEEAVYTLWLDSLGAQWPLSRTVFRRVTLASGVFQPGDHTVALANETVVGFVATQTREIPGATVPVGALLAVLVAAPHQRQGVGRRLVDHALVGLKARGVEEVQLGGWRALLLLVRGADHAAGGVGLLLCLRLARTRA